MQYRRKVISWKWTNSFAYIFWWKLNLHMNLFYFIFEAVVKGESWHVKCSKIYGTKATFALEIQAVRSKTQVHFHGNACSVIQIKAFLLRLEGSTHTDNMTKDNRNWKRHQHTEDHEKINFSLIYTELVEKFAFSAGSEDLLFS